MRSSGSELRLVHLDVRLSHTLLIKPRTLLGQFDAPDMIYLLRTGRWPCARILLCCRYRVVDLRGHALVLPAD